jgi:hypothetical protein
VISAPPMVQPAHFGASATTARIVDIAISWPARIASEPNHRSNATSPRTLAAYRSSR